MEPNRKPRYLAAQILFVTLLVTGAGLVAGLPPLMGILIALVLILSLLVDTHRAKRSRGHRPKVSLFESPTLDDQDADPPADGLAGWIGKYLPRLRTMRRRMRGMAGRQVAVKRRAPRDFPHAVRRSPWCAGQVRGSFETTGKLLKGKQERSRDPGRSHNSLERK